MNKLNIALIMGFCSLIVLMAFSAKVLAKSKDYVDYIEAIKACIELKTTEEQKKCEKKAKENFENG